LLSLFGVCTLLESKILNQLLNVNISMTVGLIFTEIYTFLDNDFCHFSISNARFARWAFFFENRKNSGFALG